MVSIGACLPLLGLAGCGAAGATANSAITVSGSTLAVYASQPPGTAGAQTTDTLDAEALALHQAGGKAGRFTIKLIPLHGRELSDNARSAIQDKTAIAYLGELVPGTSQISVEITNQQGLLEISPADTAVYLTQPTAAVSGAPTKFYPTRSTYHETFARMVPNAGREAAAQVREMGALGVSRLSVADDGSPYGASLALAVRQDAGKAGITLASGASAADGVFYAGSPGATAIRGLDQAAGAAPNAKLFAPSALYDPSFVSGLSAAAQQHLYVSAPGFLPKNLGAGGRKFISDFKAAYGHSPAPQAIFGYEAMRSLLEVLGKAGAAAVNRGAVVADFRSLHEQSSASATGAYSISGGDPSIAPFIFARVKGGALVPFTFVQLQG